LLAKSDTEGYIAKLADFGMVYKPDQEQLSGGSPRAQEQLYGSWEYMAPECYRREHGEPGFPSDIFSFGLLLWEMMSRSRIYRAFPGFENDELAPTITGSDGKLTVNVQHIPIRLANGQRPSRSAGCPEALYKVMQACWVHNMDERPAATELLNIIVKIRDKEPDGVLVPPCDEASSDDGTGHAEITYDEFLQQLNLEHKKDDLAEYLSNPNAQLTELRQMDEDALDRHETLSESVSCRSVLG
jgi:serine/threonine protein kinase